MGVCLWMCGVGVGGERERTEREDKYEEGRQPRVIAQEVSCTARSRLPSLRCVACVTTVLVEDGESTTPEVCWPC